MKVVTAKHIILEEFPALSRDTCMFNVYQASWNLDTFIVKI